MKAWALQKRWQTWSRNGREHHLGQGRFWIYVGCCRRQNVVLKEYETTI